jgi:hypothetical protein
MIKQSICMQCDCKIVYDPNASTGKYCSNDCQQEFKVELLVRGWLTGIDPRTKSSGQLCRWIKDYVKKRSNYSCDLCGWNKLNVKTKLCPIEVDHIDGNSDNDDQDNLRSLCPNCHSLTPTWKNSSGWKHTSPRAYRR